LRNFDIPDELLEEFDEAIKGKYQSRAEALRSLMRQFIDKQKKEEV